MKINVKIILALLALFVLTSCYSHQVEIRQVSQDNLHVENDELCLIASHKKEFMGKELTLAGTYSTDFRHFGMLSTKCNGKIDGLAIGFFAKTEKNNLIREHWWKRYCGSHVPYCGTLIPVTFRGVLNKYDDGIYFDVDEIIIDEKSEIRPQ